MTPQIRNLSRLRSQHAISILLIVTLALNLQAQSTGTTPRGLTLKRGQVLEMSLATTLNSRRAEVGDDVVLKLIKPLIADGVTILPANWPVRGRITDVRHAGKNCQPGSIHWEFQPLTLTGGKVIEIRSIPNDVASSRLRDALAQANKTSENGATSPGQSGSTVVGVAREIAAAPVVLLMLSFFMLSEIKGGGQEGCSEGKGREQTVRAGSIFYAEVSSDVELGR